MFGRRYFGARYYAPRYFGGGAGVTPPQPPIVVFRHGAEDPREHFERQQKEWQEDLRRIIEQAWKTANGETDPVTLEPLPSPPPPDFSAIMDALADQQGSIDQARIDAFISAERQRLEDEAIAVLLLA